MHMTKGAKIAGAVLGAALVGSAVLIPFAYDSQAREARSDVLLAESLYAVPAESATDWVSYGDQTAVVTVEAEHAGTATAEETESGEAYLSRTVDLRVKERVWARSGAAALPDTLSIPVNGWQLKDGVRLRVGSHDSSRLEVGHDYVIVFAHFSDGDWSPLGAGGILPYDEGQVGQGEYQGAPLSVAAYQAEVEQQVVPGAEEPVSYRTAGKSATSVKSLLQSTTPDPKAAQHFDLDATDRYREVAGVVPEPPDTFCSVAAPLAVSEASKHTVDELGDVIEDLSTLGSYAALHVYEAQLRLSDEPGGPDLTKSEARLQSITKIEADCGIEVGDLLPTDTES